MKYSDWKYVFVSDQDIIIIYRWKFVILCFCKLCCYWNRS